jgi:hypothetical protein
VTRIINMWAAPRNISTAMMYSWNQRSDTTVLDEPMYGHFLAITGMDHPMRDEVLAANPTDEQGVLDLMFRGDVDTPLLFIKNMAHHMEGMDAGFVDDMDSFILTRDPLEMLPSLSRGLGRIPTVADTGYAVQVEILDRVLASDRTPIVVDSAAVLEDPSATLMALCRALDIPFDPSMLSWPAGPKSIDGVWGSHWYKRLHTTTGFEQPYSTSGPLPADLAQTYGTCKPLYKRLTEYAIEAR